MRTVSLGLAALLVSAACSGKKESKPDEGKPGEVAPPTPAVEKPMAPPCIDDDALSDLLTKLWKVNPDQRVEVIGCQPGIFPEPGWFVLAWVDTGETDFPEESQLRQDIVVKGRLLTSAEPTDVAPQERNDGLSFSDFAVHDFDGDGAQEIVFQETLDYREVHSTWYRVTWRRGAKLEEAFSVPVEREVDNSGWVDDEEGEDSATVSCEASVEIDGSKIVVTGKVTTEGDPKELAVDAEGCIDGTKTFALVDGKFVAQGG